MLSGKKKSISESDYNEVVEAVRSYRREANMWKRRYKSAEKFHENLTKEIREVYSSSIDEIFDEFDYLHDDKIRAVHTALVMRIALKCMSKNEDTNSIFLNQET